jgi:cold shock CspA family protein
MGMRGTVVLSGPRLSAYICLRQPCAAAARWRSKLETRMRFEGVLCAWNPEAAFGAIRPSQGGDEVFVSLAAFPMDGEGPRLGETLSFEIVSGREGRKEAQKLRRLAAAPSPALRASPASSGASHLRAAQRKRRLAWLAGAVIVLLLAGAVAHRLGAGLAPVASRVSLRS